MSFESTTVDKEIVNVARLASKTESWRVDGSASVSVGFLSLGASGGGATSVTQTSQYSLQRISEATRKSAQSLKTLHRVEVRGVTETTTQNRMTRTITNPYRDRAVDLKAYQLLKVYSVETALTEVQPAIVARVTSMTFDREFVHSQSAFLRDHLLDPGLQDELDLAIKTPTIGSLSELAADLRKTARLALRWLFEETNVFDLPNQGFDANAPGGSYSARFVSATDPGNSAFNEALALKTPELLHVFTTMNFFYRVYEELRATPVDLDERAIGLAAALADDVTQRWERVASDAVRGADRLHDAMDYSHPVDVFRRLPGFLALVNGMLKPRLSQLEEASGQATEAAAIRIRAELAVERLKSHLTCNATYYVQQLLTYLSRRTLNQTISDFARRALSLLPVGVRRLFDSERAFVDREYIVIPALRSFNETDLQRVEKDFRIADLRTCEQVEVPTDGVHLEVVAGLCVLEDLPELPSTVASIGIREASVNVSTTVDPNVATDE
jgi:hypothetical protein